MKIKDGKQADYNEFVKVNSTDSYSLGVVKYMLRWAEMMENEINQGLSVSSAAEKTQFSADTEGITIFMYGCAVKALSQLWEHGEALRRWHNKEYGYDGDGCVNPAILTIK